MWPLSSNHRDPVDRLAAAQKKGHLYFCEVACSIADDAEAQFASGETATAMTLYRVVADIETQDKGLAEVIEHCRCKLKKHGLSCGETASDIYEQHLATMPEHDRYVFLARERIRALTSGHEGIDKIKLRREIVEFFERAQAIHPLGKKDQRIYLGLKEKV